jgi:ethanolamine utilization protein EutA
MSSSFSVPRVEIVKKEIAYRSPISFTPLLSPTEIDMRAVRDIVAAEYARFGVKKPDIRTGAVVITGETARKRNASEVLRHLSDFAGDFVVATAGPDLESIIAARGAGADAFSKARATTAANYDIGGGTSNFAAFKNGVLTGTGCLDVGGRLIQVERAAGGLRISRIAPKIAELCESKGMALRAGAAVGPAELARAAAWMAELLEMSLGLRVKSAFYPRILTTPGKDVALAEPLENICFSGGVADYIYGDGGTASGENSGDSGDSGDSGGGDARGSAGGERGAGDARGAASGGDERGGAGNGGRSYGGGARDDFLYGDIGILLGRAIRDSGPMSSMRRFAPEETIRATVVGAGSHITEISGSTIDYDADALPIKNLPILKLPPGEEADPAAVEGAIRRGLDWFRLEGELQPAAISLAGKRSPGFKEVGVLAGAILAGARPMLDRGMPLVVVVASDMAKVLGNSIRARVDGPRAGAFRLVCIDSVSVDNGDYIDIGEPVGKGSVLPVVVKTLLFA